LINKKRTKTKRLVDFSNYIFAVDKLHIQGHKGNCLKTYHPKLFSQLDEANTIVCEQMNYRFGRYKFIMKHMNGDRFNFFTYIILNELNKITCEGRFSLDIGVVLHKGGIDEFGGLFD